MQACTGHRTVGTARLVVRRGQGVAGKVFDEGRPVCVDDYDADPRISRDFADIAHADGTRAALGAPMRVRGHTVGVAMSWRRTPAAYSEADVQALTRLANLAAIAVENARLYEAQRRTVEGLREANRRLESQNEMLRRATEVHDELMRLVLEGVPLSELVEGVARLLDADVATLDAGRRAMAASGAAGAALQRRMAARLDARKPAAADERLLVRDIAAGGERLGYLGVALRHPPAPLDVVLVEQATIMCALELARERAILQARTRVRGDFLWDLLDGKIADVVEALVWARALRLELPERVRVALIRAQARPSGRHGGRRAAGLRPARVARAVRRARRHRARQRGRARRCPGLAHRAPAARRRRPARLHRGGRLPARRSLRGDGLHRGRELLRGRHRRPAGGLRAGAGRAERRAARRRLQPRGRARRARHHALLCSRRATAATCATSHGAWSAACSTTTATTRAT